MSQYHRYDEHGDALLKSEEFQKARREMRRVLWRPGQRADRCVSITRRIFLHKALLGGTAAAVASAGWLPRINTLDMAFAQEAGAAQTFRFAWIYDTPLYPREVNTSFVE